MCAARIVAGEAASLDLPGTGDLAFEDIRAGQRMKSRGRTVTEADIRLFIGATGADHPIHTDEEYCRIHPMVDRVCVQGLLTLSVLDGLLVDVLTRRMPVVMNYGHDKIRYLRAVHCGDTLRGTFEVMRYAARDADYGTVVVEGTLENQRGERVLYDRHILIVGTRALLARMADRG